MDLDDSLAHDSEPMSQGERRHPRIGLRYKSREVCQKCGKKHGNEGKKAEACKIAMGEDPHSGIDPDLCKHCGKRHAKDGSGKKARACRENLIAQGVNPDDLDHSDISVFIAQGRKRFLPTEEQYGEISGEEGSGYKRRRSQEDVNALKSVLSDIHTAQTILQNIDHADINFSNVHHILDNVKYRLDSMVNEDRG